MMNKVYGFCDAGCRYRVTPYEDFMKMAAYVPIEPNDEGIFELEVGKKYKIFDTTSDGVNFDNVRVRLQDCTEGINVDGQRTAAEFSSFISFKPEHTHAESFIFAPLHLSFDEYRIYCAWAMDGNIGDTNFDYGGETMVTYREDLVLKILVTGVSRIMLINESEISAVGIESIEKTKSNGTIDTYTISLSNGDKTTFDVTNVENLTEAIDGILAIQKALIEG